MSEPLETRAQTPSTLLTPLGAADAEICVDGVCLVPPAKEPAGED